MYRKFSIALYWTFTCRCVQHSARKTITTIRYVVYIDRPTGVHHGQLLHAVKLCTAKCSVFACLLPHKWYDIVAYNANRNGMCQGVSHTIVIYTTRSSMSDGLLPHSMVCCVKCQTGWNASGTVLSPRVGLRYVLKPSCINRASNCPEL